MKRLCPVFVATVLATGVGCSDPETPGEKTYGGRGRVASTQGGAVVMTYDEGIAVAVHRTAGFVSVVRLNPGAPPEGQLRSVIELDVGLEAKPWAAVIGADDDTAYVLLRGTQQVVRITHLHDRPQLDVSRAVKVGEEPTAIAITPSGKRLYVANWASGTISMITTSDLVAQQRTDLNLALAETGVLGSLSAAAGADGNAVWTDAELASVRPGLAHPRALAITDTGGPDEEQTLYATEFFSQPIPGDDGSDPDRGRQGFVYPVALSTGRVQTPIALPPIDTHFADAKGSATSCFPNQLYAAAVHAQKLYVTSQCASPRGPVGLGPTLATGESPSPANFQTLMHPAVFVIDTALGQLDPAQTGVLSRALVDRYDADKITNRRLPLIPNDIAVVPTSDGKAQAYITAFGADALFPVAYDGDVVRPDPHFVDLRPAGRLPIGVAVSRARSFALVMNDASDALSVVSLSTNTVVSRQDSTAGDRVNADEREGRHAFATGLEVWSFGGQAWSSCEACHPDGLSDGVTWQFARGPRRTFSMSGSYFPDRTTRRFMSWTGNQDESHDSEGLTRGTSGGVGGVLWKGYTNNAPNKNCRLLFDGQSLQAAGLASDTTDCASPQLTTHRLNGLNGSLSAITRHPGMAGCPDGGTTCDLNASPEWDQIDVYIRSLPAPKAPVVCAEGTRTMGIACLDGRYVASGRKLFEQYRCAGCHGGPGWTVARVFYTPGPTNNGNVDYVPPMSATDPSDAELAPLLGQLRIQSYVAGPLAELNPPAKATGSATFRSFAPAPASDTVLRPKLDYIYGAADQMNCALRAVGTFPVQPQATPDVPMPAPNFVGVTAPGAPAVDESRETLPAANPTAYARTLALGKDGFNVPTLSGLGLAGTYFHAGNARTLEEALGSSFSAHYQSAAFGNAPTLRPEDIRDLVSFLLSIDDDTETVPFGVAGDPSQAFDPDLCAQFIDRP